MLCNLLELSLPAASREWGSNSRFVSTSEYTAMEIYLKQLFRGLLKKANLLEKHCFVLNSAAQRYFCQSLSKLENDCAVFYIPSVTDHLCKSSQPFLSEHTHSAHLISSNRQQEGWVTQPIFSQDNHPFYKGSTAALFKLGSAGAAWEF